MSLIKLIYDKHPNGVQVEVSTGERDGDGRHPSYTMESAGVLNLTEKGWLAIRESLTRGVKQPNLLVMEQGNP